MEITISVSELAEQIIREQAAEHGKDVGEFVGEFVEENFANGKTNGQTKVNNQHNQENDDYENPFEPFIGMFSSGKTDTSTRYKEILREEIDNRGGFGGS